MAVKQPLRARDEQDSPSRRSIAIVPHDSNEVGAYLPRGIYVGVAGDITVRLEGDTADVVFAGVPAGTILPIRPVFVRATGTTAASLIGLL